MTISEFRQNQSFLMIRRSAFLADFIPNQFAKIIEKPYSGNFLSNRLISVKAVTSNL